MNSRAEKLLSVRKAMFWLRCAFALGVMFFFLGGRLSAQEKHAAFDLTVHEWGTFTAVADKQGQAVEWRPLTGFTDLPGFVEHLSYANFKRGLRGTIRMETPVLYSYSPSEQTVSVSVAFSKGVITEWYPRATHVQPGGILPAANLEQLQTDGSIRWDGVDVSPNLRGEFPREVPDNRYYAARETSSTPIRVKTDVGEQQEKFLFYRGVSAAPLPLSAKQTPKGELLVQSLGDDEIPAVIVFERRGEQAGYRLARAVKDETLLDSPVLTGSVDSLCSTLEGILVDQGLYPDEAHAMVETWRDSWFEEGSRLIYVVPRAFIDQIVPLTVDPAPTQVVRVFVGRLEVVTPATARAVATALASHDEVTLKKYERFLEPILQTVKEEYTTSTQDNRGGR
jgi:hypothetical protein